MILQKRWIDLRAQCQVELNRASTSLHNSQINTNGYFTSKIYLARIADSCELSRTFVCSSVQLHADHSVDTMLYTCMLYNSCARFPLYIEKVDSFMNIQFEQNAHVTVSDLNMYVTVE